MGLGDALREAVAEILNRRGYSGTSDGTRVEPGEIADLAVTWSDGDQRDATYGAKAEPPTFAIDVTIVRASGARHTASIAPDEVLTALLRWGLRN
ncbi:MAG: hypothetical protein WAV90_05700 [Gordonia amarae]